MATRLGLDIGTNSIGWCLIQDEKGISDIGVRIFGTSPNGAGRDPKSGASLAVDRRVARGMRRRRDRYLGRRSAFLEALVEHGLMPGDADEAKLIAARDPYDLRARALDERLDPYDIGRALFHLNQRRGFKSNRKAERKTKDAEDGKIADAARALVQAMAEAGADTLGQFLNGREGKRVRMNSDAQGYDFYPQRSDIDYEFQRIWEEQAKNHPALLTETARAALHRILFFQRDLKDQVVGKCTFFEEEERLPKVHPLFQERRLYEEVNHLEITAPGEAARKLTLDQRDKMVRVLKVVKKPSFAKLGKEIGLQPGESFNKASETRTHILGDEVYATMADKALFGNSWPNMNIARQLEIIAKLQHEENPDRLRSFLIEECGLNDAQIDQAEKASRMLPEGYGRLGFTATSRILEQLKIYHDEDGEVITYDKAVKLGIERHHSDERDGQDFKGKLPYYGEVLSRHIPPSTLTTGDEHEVKWGRITNPTVHIGLRQVEKLVNAIIAVHGRPDEIVVELARELKLNEKDKEEHNKRIRKDTAAAKQRSKDLAELEQRDTGANRALLKTWQELAPDSFMNRCCPYCGETISPTMLFDGRADIDHIIPYSRSLDDSAGNKVVVHGACNKAKGNKTPYEKWGPHIAPEKWEIISTQVARLHHSKQWRFGPDAMKRFEEEQGLLKRQLTDTQYLSRLAGRYLSSLYTPDEGRRVYVTPGRMTAMLRRLWALNDVLDDHKFVENKNSNAPKNRLDHRHHAIDAFVIAVTTMSLLRRVAEAAGRAESNDLDRMFEGLPEPWPGFRGELHDRLMNVTVSHKADRGRKGTPAPGKDMTAGRLHNDTAYGLTGDFAADGKTPIVVHRVPLTSLKPGDLIDPERIPDPVLRDALAQATHGASGKDFEAKLAKFAAQHPLFKGIRRVRVREPLSVIPIRDTSGRAYKVYKGDSNARFDVWRMPTGRWISDIVSMFDAHQATQADRRPHPAAKKVLSLRQNDMLAIIYEGEIKHVRVVKFSGNGQIALAKNNEGGPLKARDEAPKDPFKYILSSAGGLKKLKGRQIRIDPLGRVFDPGPRE